MRYLGDARLLKSIQRRWFQQVDDIGHLSYKEIERVRSVLYSW